MGKTVWIFFQRLVNKWVVNDIGGLGAALAYFALFSLFPLLLLMLSAVGSVVNPQSFDVQSWLLGVIESPEIRGMVNETLTNLRSSRGQASIIGFATLLFAASGIFGALDRSMNTIWEVGPRPEPIGIVQNIVIFVKNKLLSFLLVLGCAVLLLASIISTVVITSLSVYTGALRDNGLLWQTVQFATVLALFIIGFTVILKVLPDTRVAWREAAFGAVCAALLLTLLQKVIGIYLSQVNYTSYGVIGGVMALMVYFYLTSQIILLGGAAAAVYAELRGRRAAAPVETAGRAPSASRR